MQVRGRSSDIACIVSKERASWRGNPLDLQRGGERRVHGLGAGFDPPSLRARPAVSAAKAQGGGEQEHPAGGFRDRDDGNDPSVVEVGSIPLEIRSKDREIEGGEGAGDVSPV